MNKEIGIIEQAVGWIYRVNENPLEGLDPERVMEFFKENIEVLADAVITAFEERYPADVSDDQIPGIDKKIFMAACAARDEALSQ